MKLETIAYYIAGNFHSIRVIKTIIQYYILCECVCGVYKITPIFYLYIDIK